MVRLSAIIVTVAASEPSERAASHSWFARDFTEAITHAPRCTEALRTKERIPVGVETWKTWAAFYIIPPSPGNRLHRFYLDGNRVKVCGEAGAGVWSYK